MSTLPCHIQFVFPFTSKLFIIFKPRIFISLYVKLFFSFQDHVVRFKEVREDRRKHLEKPLVMTLLYMDLFKNWLLIEPNVMFGPCS